MKNCIDTLEGVHDLNASDSPAVQGAKQKYCELRERLQTLKAEGAPPELVAATECELRSADIELERVRAESLEKRLGIYNSLVQATHVDLDTARRRLSTLTGFNY